MIERFEDVRQWAKIRGVGGNSKATLDQRLQSQYQRVLQECVEIHEALVNDDMDEFQDAIGDTIVTLINIANIKGYKAEECLDKAFGVIEFRKGLTNDAGDFVRYGKLNKEDQKICDTLQGNSGDQYFKPEMKRNLTAENFKK